MGMDFNHLFIKGIGPVIQVRQKAPCCELHAEQYSKRDGFSDNPDSGIPFHAEMINETAGNSSGYGERLK
jgi:hypothetical protein